MSEIYPARFINCYIPVKKCNFRCEYCYILQRRDFTKETPMPEYDIHRIQSATKKERLGGMCIFNLCAEGETLLYLSIIPLIKMLLENGHNVSIVTNGTMSDAFEQFVLFPEHLRKWLYIKFSFHYLELRKHAEGIPRFFSNVHKIQNAGISFSIDITPYDELIPRIDTIIELFNENMNGALPHISVARDMSSPGLEILSKYSKEELLSIWGVFKSNKFEYKLSEFLKPHREYCYAGKLGFSLEMLTGNCRICDGAPEPFKMDFYNLYDCTNEPIPFVEIGYNCPTAHCYNCHALLTLGLIPELKTPTYADMLDRIDRDGNHWLRENIYDLYSKRLIGNGELF